MVRKMLCGDKREAETIATKNSFLKREKSNGQIR
jgi:hypothetical protein